jgi:hypothetical protein
LRDLDQTGATVGQLSAWSTAGAIFGTFTGLRVGGHWVGGVQTLIVTTGLLPFGDGGVVGVLRRIV